MKLDDIVERFILARTADGRAPRTIQDYRRVLDPFASWCCESDVDLDRLNRDIIRNYVVELRAYEWGQATIAIHIRNLRAFLHWLYQEDHTRENLATAIKAPKSSRRVENPITEEEIKLLLGTCTTSTFHDLRDRAIILLMYDTGLRSCEIPPLKMENWKRESGKAEGYLLVYASKTYDFRFSPLGHCATEAMLAYSAVLGSLPANMPLFCKEDRESLAACRRDFPSSAIYSKLAAIRSNLMQSVERPQPLIRGDWYGTQVQNG